MYISYAQVPAGDNDPGHSAGSKVTSPVHQEIPIMRNPDSLGCVLAEICALTP
jgi:hypothetical protein